MDPRSLWGRERHALSREKRQCNKHLKICVKFGDVSVVSGLMDLVHKPFSVLNIQALVVQNNTLSMCFA